MVLLRELRQAELVVFRVTKVFFRKDLSLVLHTLGLVEHGLGDMAGLDLISLVLLLNDILLDAFIEHLSIVTLHTSLIACAEPKLRSFL